MGVMDSSRIPAVARLLPTTALLWATSYSSALATAGVTKATPPAAPLGLGTAHLFGFAGGVVIFAVSIALRMRKESPTEGSK